MRTARALIGAALLLATACTSNSNPTAISAGPIDGSATTAPDSSTPATTPDSTPGTSPPDSNPTPTDSTPTDSTPTDPTDPTTPGSTPDLGTIDWDECTDELATDPDLECATLAVPLDYDDPDGETIDLALVRVPAAGDRDGAVLFNPGGPGGSGFAYIAQGGPTVVDGLGLETLDLIGFDPRGVDRSNGLRCQTDEELDRYQFLDHTPDTPEEEALLEEADAAFEEACTAAYGDTLQHYSTDNTARDMDAIRAALGDETISFLGISYGTYLGATYATLFPDRVRAMVLDSAYEPVGDTVEEQYTTQLIGFEQAFDDWAAWCEENVGCEFRSDDVAGDWDQLQADLDDVPLVNDDGREGNQSVMELATIAALYSDTQWPVLAAALAQARAGDPSGIFALADDYNGRDSDGSYDTIGQSNPIISCASGLQPALPDDPEALAETLRDVAPRFARDVTADDFGDDCAALMPTVTPRPLEYDGDAPILVVGGLNDPATPFRWAEEMTDAMGDSAVLVTFTGEGHGQLLASTCVTELEADVLVDLALPDDGTVCDPDPPVERPEWWDTLPVPDGIGDVYVDSALLGGLGLGPTEAYAELRTSELDPDAVLDAYDDALEGAGFFESGRQDPFIGAVQGLYFDESGDLLSVVALGPDAFAAPELEGLADMVPAGRTLVILLHFEA